MASNKVRIPLDRPELDAVDLRALTALLRFDLTEIERGELTKMRKRLRRADKILARRYWNRPLPYTSVRPFDVDLYKMAVFQGLNIGNFECAVGFCLFFEEYVEKIENKYGKPSDI